MVKLVLVRFFFQHVGGSLNLLNVSLRKQAVSSLSAFSGW
jgi:hypothetical protein